MARYLLVVLISLFLGAAGALVLVDPPEMGPQALAQRMGKMERIEEGSSGANPPPVAAPLPTADSVALDQLTPEERQHVTVYEMVNRSVVNITTKTVLMNNLFLTMNERSGQGSGSVLDQKGHILTNFHVVDGARNVQVTLFDGKSYEARLVGADPMTDVAVLKVDAPAESLHPVRLGSSSGLRVGQRVYAIGNPFGFERTLSTGIISSLNRALPLKGSQRRFKSYIQIDASINPGNSGGPLLNSRGGLIGMNTAIASMTGESAGVGFAIPVNTLSRIIPQLIEKGRVVRADIGIVAVWESPEGLRIQSMVPGGPAERAGLRGPKILRQQKRQGPFVYEYKTIDRAAADLIIAVDGKKTANADSFLEELDLRQPGEKVVITVVREGREVQICLRLDADSPRE